MNKKGYTVKDILPLALILGVSILAVSIIAEIIDTVQEEHVTGAAGCNSTDKSTCGYAYNISEGGLEGVDELGSWYPTIGLVIAASIVIGVLVYSFAFRS